ncbi:MAG: tetratricopeptide repeat protein [Bacteroidota bacterium]
MAQKVTAPGEKNTRLPLIALLSGILLFTCLLYLKSLHGQFLDYDDTDNVLNNAMIRQFSGDHIQALFSHAYLYMYTPLTFITFAADYALSGPDPFFFRLTNLLLHLLNISLLFLLARRLFRSPVTAGVMALLFAIHPINTDSVSWISARSNLLSATFFILALLFYLQYLDKKKILPFILVFLAFLLSLLSKPAVIFLPLTLFLFDYLEKRRITMGVILEKLPMFLLSAGFCLAAIYFRSDSGNPQSVIEYNFADRVLMIFYAPAGYLYNVLIPFNLSAIYAYPLKNGQFLPVPYYFVPFFLAGVILLVSKMKVMRREMIFGLLFFLVNLVTSQLVLLEDGFMANRYAYIPFIGIWFIIAAWFDYLATAPWRLKYSGYLVISGFLLLFSVFTWQRSQVWKDTLTLFNDVVVHSPGSAFGYNNRGIARYSANDMEGALSDYDRAIALYPGYSGAYYNRGIVCYSLKKYDLAEKDYSTAITLNPGFASSYMARGILEMDVLGNDSLSLADYSKALQINPNMAQAYYNRGILHLRMRNVRMACEDFHQVRRLGYSRADDLIRQFCE